MYKVQKKEPTTIIRKSEVEGETIEQKVERIVRNQEPISDNAPIIFTERKDGVLPSTDMRTDRFEIALDAMDKVSRSLIAKREKSAEVQENAEPIQGTGETK